MKPIIVISDADNVATALEALSPGTVLNGAATLTIREAIPRGHKVALRAIPAGGRGGDRRNTIIIYQPLHFRMKVAACVCPSDQFD